MAFAWWPTSRSGLLLVWAHSRHPLPIHPSRVAIDQRPTMQHSGRQEPAGPESLPQQPRESGCQRCERRDGAQPEEHHRECAQRDTAERHRQGQRRIDQSARQEAVGQCRRGTATPGRHAPTSRVITPPTPGKESRGSGSSPASAPANQMSSTTDSSGGHPRRTRQRLAHQCRKRAQHGIGGEPPEVPRAAPAGVRPQAAAKPPHMATQCGLPMRPARNAPASSDVRVEYLRMRKSS